MNPLIRALSLLIFAVHTPAAEVVVELGTPPTPLHVEISAGDTVRWVLLRGANPSSGPTVVKDLGGQWETDTAPPEGTVSRQFKAPGFSVYHTSSYESDLPGNRWLHVGSITIIPSAGAPAVVFLAAPVEGPVYMPPDLQPMTFTAGVNIPVTDIERVDFYSETGLLGHAESPPYRITVTQLPRIDQLVHAQLIKKNGESVASKRIRLSIFGVGKDDPRGLSFLHPVQNGKVVFHALPSIGRRTDVIRSDDLVKWQLMETVSSQRITVDDSATNSTRRFYSTRPHPLP